MTSRSIETVHVTLTIERPLTTTPRHIVKHVECCSASFTDNELKGLDFPPQTFEPTSAALDDIVAALVPREAPPAASQVRVHRQGGNERFWQSVEGGVDDETIYSGKIPPRWRPEVERFADMMEARLRDHDATKGQRGWEGSDPKWLLRRLRHEADELERALMLRTPPCACREAGCHHMLFRTDSVGEEAADVANFAMMIADVHKGLRR